MAATPADLIFHDIVGRSRQIRRVIKRIQDVAPLDIPVLISGESGVGKELVARAIHNESTRRHGPFQAVNSGAVPNDLVASELFGHEKGAFTGATSAQAGLFVSAKGGTLFLDEIASMSEEMQVSLLRVLETSEFSRVGGSRNVEADVRVIAAINENGGKREDSSGIRQDLFYRLSVYTISIPPLRQRRDDIPVLAHHFLSTVGRRLGRHLSGIEPAAMRQLRSYGWPGNVRELINVITRLIVNADDDAVTETAVIEALYSAPADVTIQSPGDPATTQMPHETATEEPRGGSSESAAARQSPVPPTDDSTLSEESQTGESVIHAGQTIEDAEQELIRLTLAHVRGNRTRAAKLLGISRKSLYNKIKLYDIDE